MDVKATTVSLKNIARACVVLCVASFALSHAAGVSLMAKTGTIAQVFGQSLWNASQVSFLLLLFGLWLQKRPVWIFLVGSLTLIMLPFAVYNISPGGLMMAVLMLAVSAVVLISGPSLLELRIVDGLADKKSSSIRIEAIAFSCYLASSLYNYNASAECWPYWNDIFEKIGVIFGVSTDTPHIFKHFFTMGFSGIDLPAFIPSSGSNGVGALVFLFLWTLIPTLYICLFLALFKMSNNLPGAKFQKALCLVAVIHFFFFTDLIDYRFGRGITNRSSEWFHWLERFIWRIAILLPIYQSLVSKRWLEARSITGRFIYYTVATWALVFFVYQVLIYDLYRFYLFITHSEPIYESLPMKTHYIQELGYHGALVVVTILYGFLLVKMPCRYLVAHQIKSPH